MTRNSLREPRAQPQVLSITVYEARSDSRYEARGSRIRVGRGDECELRPVQTGDVSVSRVHAEIVLLPRGRLVIRDSQSRNGTFVNDRRLVGDRTLRLGDRIILGDGGPDLLLEAIQLPGGERAVFDRKAARRGIPRRAMGRAGALGIILLVAGGAGAAHWFRERQQRTEALQNLDLAAVARANAPAVGSVTAYRGIYVWDGSGFVITPSGYFVTNRHVATDRGIPPDSIFVVLAGQRVGLPADLIAFYPATDPDLALLKIRDYSGAAVSQINWTGGGAREGWPGVLIGYPAAYAVEWDPFSGQVTSSVTGGTFSRVSDNAISFEGFSPGGASGSALFNADGQVVGIYRAGLRDSVAEDQSRFEFSVPVHLLIPLLPGDARAELGLQ